MVAAAAIGYYGGQMHQFIDRIPAAPTMLHFGAENPMIPLSDVEEVASAHPGVAVHVYEGADHGLDCDAAPPTTGLSQVGPTAHPRFLRSLGVT